VKAPFLLILFAKKQTNPKLKSRCNFRMSYE